MTIVDNSITLSKSELPQKWRNILPLLPTPLGPYRAPDGSDIPPAALGAIFPAQLIDQEFSPSEWVDIPEPVLEAYARWRPTPLVRARSLEAALKVRSKIYFKNESLSPSGSHKSNTALAQAYYNQAAGIARLATETGAGQWGTALSIAARHFNLAIRVYMVKVSLEQKPYRKTIMSLMGAEVLSSPSQLTQAGRAALAQDPQTPGSLGLAISEAVEEAASRPDTNYSLGSVLNHVLLHQTIIGLEVKKQLASIGQKPDYLIACHGGGSNFGGLVCPFVPEVLAGEKIQLLAAEPAACPSLTQGVYGYDYGDMAKLTPLMPMYSLGADFVPPAIHAGGLRYHGASPIVSALIKDGLAKAETVTAMEAFNRAKLFANTEYLVPAPESSHALALTCQKALDLEEAGTPGVLVFVLSGHGLLDLAAYEAAPRP
ncbi:MAG: TrpB-like pyridoxal phosphate-dependent enzyme [Deltaproteobacteria bacterium]|jgi:pyridoxal-phosphate dependent TrpB-like enzyme|nr:TrpB-like pyridoxal phosphate-dependent enzyme [Deltaproteobacteria bacterium]